MSIAGLFLLIMLFASVAIVVIWPLLQSQDKTAGEPENHAAPSTLAQLQSQHEAFLISVRDLDFDYQTGKLTEAEYLAQRESLMQRGVDILRQIDAQRSDLIERAVQHARHPG